MLKRSLPKTTLMTISGLLAVGSQSVLADPPAAFEPKPQAIAAGPITIVPGLASKTYFTDNLFSTNTQEQQSWVNSLNPSLLLDTRAGAAYFSVFSEYEKTWYASSHDDDEDRWRVLGEANVELNSRNHVDLFAEHHDTFEPRGSGFSQGGALGGGQNGPDDFHTQTYGGRYTFGLLDHNRIELRANRHEVEYDSRRATTQFRDRTNDTFGATFFWKVSPATEIFIEGDNTDIEYDVTALGAGGTLDSEQKQLLAGMNWDITGVTTGTAKIGKVWKDFESNTRKDDDEVIWQLGLQWTPISYSTFGITSSSNIQETNGSGNAYSTREWEVYNIHSWSERLRSRLSYSDATDEYEGNAAAGTATNREDDRTKFLVGAEYQMRRWLVLGLEASQTEKDSNQNFDFEKNVYLFTINASL